MTKSLLHRKIYFAGIFLCALILQGPLLCDLTKRNYGMQVLYHAYVSHVEESSLIRAREKTRQVASREGCLYGRLAELYELSVDYANASDAWRLYEELCHPLTETVALYEESSDWDTAMVWWDRHLMAQGQFDTGLFIDPDVGLQTNAAKFAMNRVPGGLQADFGYRRVYRWRGGATIKGDQV